MAKRLSLFAGSGALVPHVIKAAVADGYKVQVLALVPRPDLEGVKVIAADIGNPLGIIWSLKVFRTSHIAMAGGIVLSDKSREGLARFANGGSNSEEPAVAQGDAALSGLSKVLKSMTGADLVGVQEIAPDLLVTAGHLAGPELDAQNIELAHFALGVAREIGRLDIGQAVVTTGRHVIAAEDIGGTDALLSRVSAYVADGRTGRGTTPLILAKAVKPQQTHFVDLPAIGPDTIINARRAGVSVVVIEAGGVLLIERDAILAAAEREGITVIALENG